MLSIRFKTTTFTSPRRATRTTATAAFLGALLASSAANAAATSVPEFDPQADVVLDLNGGAERPDTALVTEAFEAQFADFDVCVAKAKKGSGKRLRGDAEVEVLLNPEGATPLGVNATVPPRAAKKKGLRACLRSAIAAATYPAFDGPPVVVEFDFELDPGFAGGE